MLLSCFRYDTQNSLGCTSVLSPVSHRNYPGSKDGHIHTLLDKRGTAEFVLGPDGNSLLPTGQWQIKDSMVFSFPVGGHSFHMYNGHLSYISIFYLWFFYVFSWAVNIVIFWHIYIKSPLCICKVLLLRVLKQLGILNPKRPCHFICPEHENVKIYIASK